MKIGFVRRGYSPTGGAEAYLQRLAHGVAAEGHQPVLISSRDWPQAAWPNDLVVHVDGVSPLRFAREVERASSACDVVFSLERIFSCDVYRAGDGVHRAWLERRRRFESPWRRLTRWTNPKHRELLQLERCVFSTQRTRLVIANSRMVHDEIVTHYGYPADRIKIIPNGYDAPPLVSGLREKRRAELGVASDAFVVLFAGSGWERKGLQTALDAVRDLPAARLIVAGKGSVSKFRAPANALFVGPRMNLQPDFAAADAFALPTVYDPFSNACLEALAAGLPVLTTSANGFSEVITDGIHGSIFAPGDVKALRDAMRFWAAGSKATEARGECLACASLYPAAQNTRLTLDAIMTLAPK